MEDTWEYIYKKLFANGPLNFLISSTNLSIFNQNYQYYRKNVLDLLIKHVSNPQVVHEMRNLFNLEAFRNIFQVELTDFYEKTLAKMWGCTND